MMNNFRKFEVISFFALFSIINTESTVCNAGTLPIIQNYILPAEPSLLASDETHVFVSFPPVTKLFGYKRTSSGLVLGSNYTESENKSLTIPGMYESVASYKNELYVGTFIGIGLQVNYVMPVDTSRLVWRVDESFNTVLPGGMTVDQYGFVYLNDEISGIYVYNFTDTTSYKISILPYPTAGRGTAIKQSGDKFFMSLNNAIAEFDILRNNTTQAPISLEFVMSHNVSFPGQFRTLTFTKAGSLVALNDDPATSHLVYVFDKQWRQRIYCSYGNVPLNSGWADMDFGYFMFVTGPQNLYVVPNIF